MLHCMLQCAFPTDDIPERIGTRSKTGDAKDQQLQYIWVPPHIGTGSKQKVTGVLACCNTCCIGVTLTRQQVLQSRYFVIVGVLFLQLLSTFTECFPSPKICRNQGFFSHDDDHDGHGDNHDIILLLGCKNKFSCPIFTLPCNKNKVL